jgi:uncharacterized Zn-binding protein involved in type VI secretion
MTGACPIVPGSVMFNGGHAYFVVAAGDVWKCPLTDKPHQDMTLITQSSVLYVEGVSIFDIDACWTPRWGA